MIDNSQIVSSVVVDETGAVIVLELWHFGSHDSRPDNLEEDKFWACTYRAVIKIVDKSFSFNILKRISEGSLKGKQ